MVNSQNFDFELLKANLKKLLHSFSFKGGPQTDVWFNFNALQKFEKKLWDLQFTTLYEDLSPKLNSGCIEIYPKDESVIEFVRKNQDALDFFENFYFGYRHPFSFHRLLYGDQVKDKPNQYAFSIMDYLKSELRSDEQSSWKINGMLNPATINIVASAVEAAKYGHHDDENLLIEFLFHLNLALVLLPQDSSKKEYIPIEERLFIINPEQKLISKSKLYRSASNSRTKLLVTHVVSEKKEVVQDEKEIKRSIASEVKREEDELKRVAQSLANIFDH